MIKQFEAERYTLVKDDRVRVSNYRFGRNLEGECDVWIERGNKGERFMSQIILQGEPLAVRKEIYSRKCYILREKATRRYYFLDMNDCGFWLHSESFFGAVTFFGDEIVRIQNWLRNVSH